MRTTPFGAPPARARARGMRRAAGVLSVASILITASVVWTTPSVASADTPSYPSWNDVVQARKNVAAKQTEIKNLQALITQLDANVTATTAVAQVKGDAYGTAQDAYYSAEITEQSLAKQAAAAEATSKQSQAQAGQLAAQLARSGSNGFELNLFLNGTNATKVLDGIGASGKISERADNIYKHALQDKNTAQALTDQANVAKAILNNLKIVAQNAYEVAQKAANDAAAALAASNQHKAELQAQLAALTTDATMTQAKYLAGIQAQFGINGDPGTEIASTGWARPAVGVITSGFGMRVNPVDGGYRLHNGTDLADGCNVPVYAAHAGTVTYAGWYGGLGYFIQIEADSTYSNGYGHIAAGQLYVQDGQSVNVGQLIARTGATGEATGCHLHFMVIVNGTPVDAVPFMRSEGIVLG